MEILIAEIYETVLAPEGWSGVLERLGDTFGRCSAFVEVHNVRAGPSFTAVARIDSAYVRTFHEVHADPNRNFFRGYTRM